MKKSILIVLMTCTLLCAKAQTNTSEVRINTGTNKPGDELVLGTDNIWHSLPIGKVGNVQVVLSTGMPGWVDPSAITGLKGATGATGPAGPAGATGSMGTAGPPGPAGQNGFASLPGQTEGSTPAFINGQWIAVPASYNIDVSWYPSLTASYTLVNVPISKSGQYTVSVSVDPLTLVPGSSITAVVTYTDINGIFTTIPSANFPAISTTGETDYSAVHIMCKAGTAVNIQTVVTGSATYAAGDIVHQLN
jgi:hypothetical protein